MRKKFVALLIGFLSIFAAPEVSPKGEDEQRKIEVAIAEEERRLETMVASWYGESFNGRLTATGEKYDMNKI